MVAATSQADVKQLTAWARLRGTVGYQASVCPAVPYPVPWFDACGLLPEIGR